jgi:hypothetical protein
MANNLLSCGCQGTLVLLVMCQHARLPRLPWIYQNLWFRYRILTYPLINCYISTSWQQLWSSESSNKLHSIEPNIKDTKTYQLPRRDGCIIHQLRIDDIYFTHRFLLRKKDPPECIACQLPLSVQHILLNCIDFNLIRQKYFTCMTLAELFSDVPFRTIVDLSS